MIPILFGGAATSFETEGLGRLTDCISCEVVEERNGPFELVIVYPTTGIHYEDLEVSKLIVVDPNHTQTRQAFEIYEITRPINNKVTVYASHISYRQSFVPIEPFTATGITETLAGIKSHEMESNSFTFWTDITNEESAYNQNVPKSMRQCLGGTEGSILDTFSGSGAVEYEWDNFVTKIWSHRGADNGVKFMLGKNIIDINHNVSLENVITGVLPTWSNTEGDVTFYGDIQYSANVDDYPVHRTVILDLSDHFDGTPTVDMLNRAGAEYVAQASLATPNTNIKVKAIDLASTLEYSGAIEQANLCDTIEVVCKPYGISYKAKVIKVKFDVLAGNTLEVEIGDNKSSFSNTIVDIEGDVSEVISTGKKLVSVAVNIDREVGEIKTTIGSVNETGDGGTGLAGQVAYNTSQISQLDNTITSKVSTEITNRDLATKSYVGSEIEQAVDHVQITISQITDLPEEVNQLSTYFDFTDEGLYIGKQGSSDATFRALYSNVEMVFLDMNDVRLAWLNANDGLGASKISIGDPDDTNRWQWVQNGNYSWFTRHL